MNRKYGLGIIQPYTFTPDPSKMARSVTQTTNAPTTSSGGNWLDKIFGFAERALPIVNKASNIANQYTQPGNAVPSIPIDNRPLPSFDPNKGKLSTAAKVGIGLGAAAFVGTVIYLATRKK